MLSILKTKKTVLDYIEFWSKKTPDKIAFAAPKQKNLTYRELMHTISFLQKEFVTLGIHSGSIVAIRFHEPTCFSVALIALMQHATVVPIMPSFTFNELESLLIRCNVSAFLSDTDFSSEEKDFMVKNQIGNIQAFKENNEICGQFTLSGTTIPHTHNHATHAPNHFALILQTTGSTEKPKLVPITQKAILSTCSGSIKSMRIRTTDRCLNFMPLNHIHGLVSQMFIPLLAGSTCIMPQRFQSSQILEWINQYKPTWFSTSPAIYKEIVKQASEHPEAIKQHALRFLRVGSAPLTTNFAHELEQTFNVPLLEAYGMTETLQITGNPLNKRKIGSVGKSVSSEIGIFDGEFNRLKAFETGSIWVKGDAVLTNYYDEEKPNKATFHNGWFKTGDLGWLDNDGYLYLSGREKEFINKGGEKISPFEVESALLKIPGIEEAFVFPYAHPLLGEDIGAAVVWFHHQPFSDVAIKNTLQTVLSTFKVPSIILRTDDLEKTENGKLKRRDLALRFQKAIENKPTIPENKVFTESEVYVANWFCRILRTEVTNLSDDFFSLGGTSLDTAELLAGIGNELGEFIHGISFLRNPTISGFANFLEQEYPEVLGKLLVSRPNATANVPTKVKIEAKDLTEFRKTLPQRSSSLSINKSKKISPVFLLSAPRSGSTLLRTILSGHTKLFAPPELRLMHFETLGQWKRALSGEFTFYQEGLCRAVMAAFNTDYISALQWINVHAQKDTTTTKIYELLNQSIEPRRIVDKTPHYCLQPEVLTAMENQFNQPFYIHLLRNPADMKSSFLKTHIAQLWMHSNQFTPEQLAELIWHESNQNVNQFLSIIPENRKIKIFFEDLIDYTEATTMQICNKLHVEYEKSMLNVYSNPKERMTDGVTPASKMIGDPNFFKHQSINPTVSKAGKTLDSNHKLGLPIIDLALELGYEKTEKSRSLINTGSLSQQIIEDQKRLVALWKGERIKPESLILCKNCQGKKPPLFWCFQAYDEFDALAKSLGENQPLYGMRSGHLLFKKDWDSIIAFAKLYTKEMLEIIPSTSFYLGGNCQGGRIAFEIGRELNEKGYNPDVLFLLDVEIEKPYPGNIALFYGARSEEHNPFFKLVNPEIKWKQFYHSYSVNLINGEHGQYFSEPALSDMTDKILSKMRSTTSD